MFLSKFPALFIVCFWIFLELLSNFNLDWGIRSSWISQYWQKHLNNHSNIFRWVPISDIQIFTNISGVFFNIGVINRRQEFALWRFKGVVIRKVGLNSKHASFIWSSFWTVKINIPDTCVVLFLRDCHSWDGGFYSHVLIFFLDSDWLHFRLLKI